jgi:hypothetical protein
VSLPSEWSWAIRLYAANVVAPYWGAHANVVLEEKFKRYKQSQSGALFSPGLRVSGALINFLCKTNRKISFL